MAIAGVMGAGIGRAVADSVADWIDAWTGSQPYPSQLGLPGWPWVGAASIKRYLPDETPFKWGYAERIPYPGSVEHVRCEPVPTKLSQMPCVPLRNAKTLVRSFRATQMPGIAPDRVVKYAEPVYFVCYKPVENPYGAPGGRRAAWWPTGESNAPVDAVKWEASDPPFDLALGELAGGRPYVIRVIAATPAENVQKATKRLVIRCQVNDGPAGETSHYRKRCAAVDEFYSVAEFFFYAPERRAYQAKLWIDPTSKLPLLVYNIDVHDCLAQVACRAGKKGPSLYDERERAEVWRAKALTTSRALPPEDRLRRDAEIWGRMAPLNSQALGDAGASWNSYVAGAPLPAGAVDDGTGVDSYGTDAAKARGMDRQTAYPVATDLHRRLVKQFYDAFDLARRYHESGDPEVGRDAAVCLASIAWKLPTEDTRQEISAVDCRAPDGRWDWAFRHRARSMPYFLRDDWAWPNLTEAYDRLFPLIQHNEELAASLSRFMPWIKTPADLVKFFDTNLLQYRAHLIMAYQAYLSDPTPGWMAKIAAVQQSPEIAGPWIEWLFKYAWTFPNPPMGVDELITNNIQRDGTHKIGSHAYAAGGNFGTELVELLGIYQRQGGRLPYDLTNMGKCPKAVAMTYFTIEYPVAGGYHFQIGDVGGPNMGRYFYCLDPELVRLGWRWTHDPRFAWVISNSLGRAIETDAEWAAITAAAQKQRNPIFVARSRVLSDWFGVLETGTESDDFRFRRAVGLRVGSGLGHQHRDPLDLQIWAHGVPVCCDGGQRMGYSKPDCTALCSHNTVVSSMVDQDQNHRWISSFADAAGARYLEGRVLCAGEYSRQIALIDATPGKPSAQPLPAEKERPVRLPADVVTPDSYVVDVFRVRGGEAPLYAFHGPPADRLETNVIGRQQPAAAGERFFKDNRFITDETTWTATCPDELLSVWRMRRDPEPFRGLVMPGTERSNLGINFVEGSPRKFIRMHLLGHRGDTVLGARTLNRLPAPSFFFTFDNLYVRPAKWEGETLFPVIYEPFAGEPFIDIVKLLTPVASVGKAGASVAFELSLHNGRRDLVVVSPRAAAPVVLPGVGTFQGEFAYVSRDDKGIRQAMLAGGSRLAVDGLLIEAPIAAYEGEVVSVDYYAKTAVLSGALLPACANAVIEIGPDSRRTSYTLGAVKGAVVSFTRGMDLAASRIVGFSDAGQPATHVSLAMPGMTISNDAVTALWRVGPNSKSAALELVGGPNPADRLKPGELLRVWEFGPGDRYRLPVWVNVQRGADGQYRTDGNVRARVRFARQDLPVAN